MNKKRPNARIIKFNGGSGAILCNKCKVIVKQGWGNLPYQISNKDLESKEPIYCNKCEGASHPTKLKERRSLKTMENSFKPDWVSPPGDTIMELLKQRMATCLDISLSTFQKITEGDLPLTENLINKLDIIFRDIVENKGTPLESPYKVLNDSTSFWKKREARYVEEVKRLYKIEENEADLILNSKISNMWVFPNKSEDTPTIYAFEKEYNKKSYITVKFKEPEKTVHIIRRLLHQDKIRHGMYWDAGQNFNKLMSERPSYEVHAVSEYPSGCYCVSSIVDYNKDSKYKIPSYIMTRV